MKPTKKDIHNKLYYPIKIINGKKEFMFDTHGKIKSYRSTATLKIYAPDYDAIATYTLSGITIKQKLGK